MVGKKKAARKTSFRRSALRTRKQASTVDPTSLEDDFVARRTRSSKKPVAAAEDSRKNRQISSAGVSLAGNVRPNRKQKTTAYSRSSGSSDIFRNQLFSIPNNKESLRQKCDLVAGLLEDVIAAYSINEDHLHYPDPKELIGELKTFKTIGMSVSGTVAQILRDYTRNAENPDLREEREQEASIRFVNASGIYHTGCKLSLINLHSQIRTINYDPSFFDSAVLSLPSSDCKTIIFPDGKFIITGASTARVAQLAARHVLSLLTLCGYQPEISLNNFRLTNLTAVCDLRRCVNLNGLVQADPTRVIMDSEAFPAAYILPEKESDRGKVHYGKLGLSYLVFATGKIVLTGGTSEKHLLTSFRDSALPLVAKFCYGSTV